MKRILSVCLLLVAALTLSGCQQYDAKASYFEGTVLAEYHQTRTRGSDDTFTLTFYEPGKYEVEFTRTPGQGGRGSEHMPQNFTVELDQAPRVRVISQYILPDFLRVTIKHNGKTETHDFQ
jgi:opacity protein-like surface antigen